MAVPVLDFSVYQLGKENVPEADLEKLSDDLRKAFTEVGFVYLKNTGINQEEVEKVMSVSKRFFSLPENKKKPFSRGSFSCSVNHGWVSLETECLNPRRPGDLKEAFNTTSLREDINWPSEEVADFRDTKVSFFLRCKELALKVLRLMAVGLGMDSEIFVNKHKHIGSFENGTTLRSLYYPPVDSTRVKENQVRCGEHSDYGSITLLFQSTEDGLQVQNRAGEFVSAPCIPGTVLVNIADLMQRWTSDVYVSAVHRALLPPAGNSRTRQSLAFFVQPENESIIKCCDGSDKYPPIKTVDYFTSRFNDTYGKTQSGLSGIL
ncbi:UPF0676 protein C1494.01 isoform X1 [Megalobrama amblycephala]|uniref:UPF0676 protein C1494.01 isoform X1 n=2 Tax=Megalobrama amblycephala TaxID=75352 RepID=UPI0020140A55|nr:UPF0676 protein C1494.01 isoform X1 [Megalobrama amblycephala]